MHFRTDVHGLRGIAILLVILFHAHVPGVSGGFVGVDVFFVLSGFLITRLLVRELNTTGTINFVEFYARRARRLLPAAAVVLATTMVAALLLLSPLEQQNFAGTSFATALYLSNIWFALYSTDYLAAPPDYNPLLHTWSLSVEEQFYLVWPLLMFLASRRACQLSRRLGIAMIIVALASFGASVWMTGVSQPWAFFGSPTRAWEFALGALPVLVPHSWFESRRRLAATLAWVGLTMIVLAALAFGNRTLFPGVAALLPVVGTTLIILSCNAARPVTVLLSSRALQWFGDVSYVWYLWHWPVLVFAQAIIPDLTWTGRVSFAVLSLAVSAVTRRLLEDRVRFSSILVPRPWLTAALAIAVTTFNAGATRWWRDVAVQNASNGQQHRFALAQQDNPRIYRNGCHLDYAEVSSPDCVFGDAASPTIIVLFGDSHAAQWFPALERLAIDQRWRLISLTKSGCPATDIWPNDPRLGRPYFECDAWRRDSMNRIAATRPALVVVASANVYVDVPDRSRRTGTSLDEWSTALRRTLSHFDSNGIRSALFHDSPIPGFDVPTCLARADWQPWIFSDGCDFVRSRSLGGTVAREERRAVAGLRDVHVVEVSEPICPTMMCDSMREGIVIYRDDRHLTAGFSAKLATALRPGLIRLMDSSGAAILDDATARFERSSAEPARTSPTKLSRADQS